MKKILALLMVLILVVGLIACTPPGTEPTDGNMGSQAETNETEEPNGDDALKVALLLGSTIDDEGWSQTSYTGFKKAEKDFRFEGAYTESIALPDQESIVRNYASSGYNVIILSSADFTDVGVNMALEYPDVKFILINGNAAQEPNLANYRPMTIECGFVAGAFSALVSKNNAVGIVNGQKFPPVEDAGKGFEAGAKYVNPDIDVRVAYTDSWTDIQKAYEASLGMIEAGVDVLSSNCSDGVAGVVQAAQENDILVTGYIGDQHELAPDTIPFSSIQDIGMLIYAGIEDVINGNFKAEVIPGGAAQGVIGLSPFYQLNGEEVPQEIQNRMKEIYEGIVDGSLKASGDLPASVFE